MCQSGHESKRRNNMNKIKIATSQCGALLGMDLLTVKVENVDLKYNEKKEADPNGLRLNKPLKKYIIEAITVNSVKADTDAEGQAIVIFNDKPEMQFLVAKGIEKPSNDTVKDAVNAAVNGNTRFFSSVDYPILFSLVDALNAKNQNEANAIAEELIQQAALLKNLRGIQKDSYDRYKTDFDTTL